MQDLKIYWSIELAAEIADANARALEAVASAMKLLEEPPPNTFLGRKQAMPNDAICSARSRQLPRVHPE